jgi:hypothetical protein
MNYPEFNLQLTSRKKALTPGPSPKKGRGGRSLIRGFCTAQAVQKPRISVFSPSSASGEGAGGWGFPIVNPNWRKKTPVAGGIYLDKQKY